MVEYLIDCVTKPNRNSRHEHITHIGNTAGTWKLMREDAISMIDSKNHNFYTVDRVSNSKVYIGVVRDQGHAPFLRTYADKKWNDNLLAQPECPPSCKLI